MYFKAVIKITSVYSGVVTSRLRFWANLRVGDYVEIKLHAPIDGLGDCIDFPSTVVTCNGNTFTGLYGVVRPILQNNGYIEI